LREQDPGGHEIVKARGPDGSTRSALLGNESSEGNQIRLQGKAMHFRSDLLACVHQVQVNRLLVGRAKLVGHWIVRVALRFVDIVNVDFLSKFGRQATENTQKMWTLCVLHDFSGV
jgi:hypothetical protein